MNLDYKKLGLKCGLEIHQQLDTGKLFCRCPSIMQERDPDFKFERKLHAVAGETGLIDPAALQAYLADHSYTYHAFRESNCLVELDEEPPGPMDSTALDTVLTVSKMLNCDVIDEVHVMRKTVIDGSNVSGFQRTSLVAVNGSFKVGDLEVKIPTICIEEDAARKVDEKDGTVTYSLDRLGIPLIELATDPCITTPEQAKEVAKAIGAILRATRQVKRGIGTIRQDVNISIREGARVELKGLQDLSILSKSVELEVQRQVGLLEIKNELKKRKAKVDSKPADVSKLFAKSESKVIKSALEKSGSIYGLKLSGFAGLLKKELQPDRRFGSELADYAKAYGSKGLFHSDELPNYGITEKEIETVRKELGCKENDAFILIAEQKDVCEKCIKAVAERAQIAFEGVPEQTRRVLPEGTSAFMRPLPGGARMYPETDLSPIVITDKKLKELKLPKLPWEQIAELGKKHGLSKEVAGELYDSMYLELFEKLVKEYDSSILATTFTNHIKALEDPQVLQEEHFKDLFKSLKQGKFSKEAIPDILEKWAEQPGSKLSNLVSDLGVEGIGVKDLESIIKKVVDSNKKLIEEKGERALQPLMGMVMKEARGKADGKKVMELLKKAL
ncbi:MAG: Glu-tRNA(Gln) amidotransferase subunit GatE [archaeon]